MYLQIAAGRALQELILEESAETLYETLRNGSPRGVWALRVLLWRELRASWRESLFCALSRRISGSECGAFWRDARGALCCDARSALCCDASPKVALRNAPVIDVSASPLEDAVMQWHATLGMGHGRSPPFDLFVAPFPARRPYLTKT
jgi:hypothetical protein